ncbi:MAG: hypothetical protein U5N55_05080 [Cypionkella sp.]|nr:hypothetical protein [Cypionkella sp.]
MIDRTIEAVSTIYQGVTFRSALEAQWAAFFDFVGIEWVYEPKLLSGWLPDFLIAGKWYAEVKPVSIGRWQHVGRAGVPEGNP